MVLMSAQGVRACVRAQAPGKQESIFLDINTEEIQPMYNILHMYRPHQMETPK